MSRVTEEQKQLIRQHNHAHPEDECLRKFVTPWLLSVGAQKLRENAYKGSWREVSTGSLFTLLLHEVAELNEALHDAKPDRFKVVSECADILNFAAMIADLAC